MNKNAILKIIDSVGRKSVLILYVSVLSFISSTNSFAQCTILPIAVQGISLTYVQAGGTNASGVAFNPNLNLYYAIIAGSPVFPYETFDAAGNPLYQTNGGFDFRGLWWNPNTNQVEGTGYFNFGLWTSDLDGSGNALNTGTLIYPGQNQPDAQSCGDYDCEADEIVFYFNGAISRYARSNGSFLGSYPLTGMPVPVGNINWTSVIYTGCLGNEIGIEDWSAKSILLFNKATGAYSGTSFLPASAVTNNGFRFSYANNLAWLYAVSTRTWTSYSIFSGQPTGGGSTVNLGNDTTLCFGNTLLLDAGNVGANYLWQDGSTNQTFNVTQTGTYIVAVSNGGCYVAHDTIVVNVIGGGGGSAFSLGNDTTLCAGATLVLDATTAGATYVWQDGSTNSIFNASITGLYFVTVNVSGCTATDSINVNFATLNSVNLGNDTAVCQGQSVLLDATTAGASYLWQDNSTNATFNVLNAGTYSVTVTIGNCSPISDNIIITFNSLPAVALGNDTTLCAGQTFLLDATLAGATYNWQNSSINSTYNVVSGGNYAVTVTDGNGCSNSDNINVTYNNPPLVNLGNDSVLCAGQTLTLTVSTAGATYLWHDGSTNFSFNVSSAGMYWVEVTVGPCTNSDTINISYVNPPTVYIGNDTTLCPGQTILLDATTANSIYSWQDNSVNAIFTVAAPGIYWVDVTAGSCAAIRDSIVVSYINASSVNLGNDSSLCPGQTILLDATQPGASYLWQDGSTDSIYIVTTSGNYHVTVTISICNAADTISVIYYPLPFVNFGADTVKCPDDELILNAQNTASTYLWHNSSYISGYQYTTPSISITDSATYWVDVTNVCATATDTIHVGFKICDCHIFVPTAFTPNGDEMNDVFQPKFICDFIDYDFRIFNRWGELIYSTTDQTEGWDGTFHGFKENTGVFVWVLLYKYNDSDVGTVGQLKGDVTLLK